MPMPTSPGVIRAADSRTDRPLLIRRNDLRRALDVKAVNWGVDSDDRATVTRFRTLCTIFRTPAPKLKIGREKLQNKGAAGAFRVSTARHRGRLAGERGGPGEATASDKRGALRKRFGRRPKKLWGQTKVGGGWAVSWRRRSGSWRRLTRVTRRGGIMIPLFPGSRGQGGVDEGTQGGAPRGGRGQGSLGGGVG